MRKSLLKRIAELEREVKPQRDPKEIPECAREIIAMMLSHRDKLEVKDESDKKEN
jgi:hypothetical protein